MTFSSGIPLLFQFYEYIALRWREIVIILSLRFARELQPAPWPKPQSPLWTGRKSVFKVSSINAFLILVHSRIKCNINLPRFVLVSSTKQYSVVAALQFLRNTVKNDGVSYLWRGNSAQMVRVIPYAAVHFCAFEQWKRLLRVDKDRLAYLFSFLQFDTRGFLSKLQYPVQNVEPLYTIPLRKFGGEYGRIRHLSIGRGPGLLGCQLQATVINLVGLVFGYSAKSFYFIPAGT